MSENPVDQLLRELKERADASDDADTNQLFRELLGEIRKLNKGSGSDRAAKGRGAETQELLRRFPVLRTRIPVDHYWEAAPVGDVPPAT